MSQMPALKVMMGEIDMIVSRYRGIELSDSRITTAWSLKLQRHAKHGTCRGGTAMTKGGAESAEDTERSG